MPSSKGEQLMADPLNRAISAAPARQRHGTCPAAAPETARLERAFHSAVQTYQRLKHGNRQVIRIERIEV